MDKDSLNMLSKLLEGFISTLKPKDEIVNKYFHNDGRPATEVAPDRENYIHLDEIKNTMEDLVDSNSPKDKNTKVISDVLDSINNPSNVTKGTKDGYNLTNDQRRWLLEYIFAVEGKYFNHPNDPGGETMYGIIKSEARKWGYMGNMKDLPKEVATEIYLKKYWKAFSLDKITDFKKALCIFDFIVNSGVRGVKVAQATINKINAVKSKLSTTATQYKDLNNLVVDGKIGPKTIEAINMVDFREFTYIYLMLQEDTYEDLMRANSKLRVFDEGWENRIAVKALYLRGLEDSGL